MRISDWSSDVCSSYRAYCLWQHPDQRQLLIDDPSLIGNAVEETLRFDGSSQIIVRRAGKDVTMRGKTIPEGARIGLCIISANRDPDKYRDPDRYAVQIGRASCRERVCQYV